MLYDVTICQKALQMYSSVSKVTGHICVLQLYQHKLKFTVNAHHLNDSNDHLLGSLDMIMESCNCKCVHY